MRIQHNIQALNAHRQMGVNNSSTAKNLEKLSSGYRINRAGDDAAGLAISEKMRSQIRGLTQATRNSQDGVSLIQTAEGALQETEEILQRMRELAVQSSNGIYDAQDRAALDTEIQDLKSEVDRISTATTFNNIQLLNGDLAKPKLEGTIAQLATGNITSTGDITVAGGENGDTVTFKSADADASAAYGADGNLTVTLKTNTEYTADEINELIANADTTALAEGTEPTEFEVSIADNGSITAGATAETTGVTATISDGSVEAADAKAELTLKAGVGAATKAGNAAATIGGVANFNIQAKDSGTLGNITIKFTEGAAEAAAWNAGGTELTVTLDQTKDDYDAASIAAAINAGVGGANMPAGWTGVEVTGGGTVNATTATVNETVALSGGTDAADAVTLEITAAGGGAAGNELSVEVTTSTNATAATFADGKLTINVKTGEDLTQDKITEILEGVTGAPEGVTFEGTLSATVAGANVSTVAETDLAGGQDAAEATKVESGVTFQIGANGTEDQRVSLNIDDMSAKGLKIADLTIGTQEDANKAIETIDKAIETISMQRAKLGGLQNRLEHTINNLGVTTENLTASESRIRDVDMAEEMTNFTKNNILQQAAQSMLAQANQLPQNILQLLR